MQITSPSRPLQLATRRRQSNLLLIAATALVLLVAMLAQPATAFDFFQTFFGGQNQGQGQQRDSSGDRGHSSSATNECSDYICPLPSPSASSPKYCVVDPRDCPCARPALETKCPVGDWYTCVPNSIVLSVDGCKAYLSKLNGPGAFDAAGANAKRSEL